MDSYIIYKYIILLNLSNIISIYLQALTMVLVSVFGGTPMTIVCPGLNLWSFPTARVFSPEPCF